MRSIVFGVMSAITLNALPAYSQTTYYIDATQGNDQWSGTFASAQTTDGPWRTIDRVNNAALRPGDSVLFKCGEIWREQLVVPSSGIAGNPITFGSYGSCDSNNKPVIDGSTPIDNWTMSTESRYVAQAELYKTPVNLIENETFDSSVSDWTVSPSGSTAELSWQAQCDGERGGCLVFTAATSAGSMSMVHTNHKTGTFPLEAGQMYQLDFWAKAAQSTNSIAVRILRAGPGYEIGFGESPALTTAWQHFSYPISPTMSFDKARLDFRLPEGAVLHLDNVVLKRVSPEYGAVKQVFVDGRYQDLAQHPNRGYLPDRPSNVFLSIANDQLGSRCPVSGGTGTTTFTAGADLVLTAAQAQDLVGSGIHIRTNQWMLDDRTISAYDAATKNLTLGSASSFNLCRGWGYYLDNQLWMLDQPGEWYFHNNTRQLHIMPDVGMPEGRVEAGYRDYGVYARSRSYVVFDGLAIRKAVTGIDLRNSTGFVVRNTDVYDSAARAVVVENGKDGVIDGCNIINSVREAIWALNARNMKVMNNYVANTGVIGSPKKTDGAIHVDCTKCAAESSNALIAGNIVQNSGYVGIYLVSASTASNNIIEDSCVVLDDCGGIYTRGNPNNSRIIGNIVRRAWGNPNGRPATVGSAAQGIYLDNRSDGVQVVGNTVTDTDNGFQLHIASNNTVSGNIVYGARRSPVWIQETTLAPAGTVRGNIIHGNQLFPVNTGVSYSLSGAYSTIDFASYDNNRYSSLYSPVLGGESYYPGGTYVYDSYTFPRWVHAKGDFGSTIFDAFTLALRRLIPVNGSNLIANSNFDVGINQWGGWHGTSQWINACIAGGCLKFTRDANAGGQANSNSFSAQQGTTYLVQFDLRGGQEGQRVNVVLRGAGTPNYKYLGLNQTLVVGNAWESYSLPVTATETRIYDGRTESGARLDFEVDANQHIYVDNVRIEAVTVETNDLSDDSAILVNNTAAVGAMPCPDSATEPNKCLHYVRFADGAPISWPITLAAMSSDIAVWTDNPMKDTDGDAIVDIDDACVATPAGASVNRKGCSFMQQYQDADSDGYVLPVDCDDTDGSVHPEALEIPRNSTDEDCAGGDSTIDVLQQATANVSNKDLSVEVVSQGGANDRLSAVGYDQAMIWSKYDNPPRWRLETKYLGTEPPTALFIKGAEGTVAVPVYMR